MLIAQVTDTHFGARPETAGRNAAVIGWLLAADPRPDLVIVTGDVADHGVAEEYEQARDTFAAWPGPIAFLPGNHDRRAPFCEVLLGEPARQAVNTSLTVGDVHVVLLDSLIERPERYDPGRLSHDTLTWLDDDLCTHTEPTLVAVHHPPVSLGMSTMDSIGLLNPDALAAVLSKHPQVRAVLVGHAHAELVTTFAGLPLLVGGGVASAVRRDEESGPALWYDAPASFALHSFLADGRLVTHWRSLPSPPA